MFDGYDKMGTSVVRGQVCLPSSVFPILCVMDFTRPQVPHLFSGDANALCIGFTVLLAEGLTQNDVYGHL